MITYAEALQLILAESSLLDEEWLALDQCAGRVVARPVASRVNVPAFANAAMDGYALAATDTAGASAAAPVRLPVTAVAAAGTAPPPAIAGQVTEIMTGAPLPAGADAVLPRERVRWLAGTGPDHGCIEISEAVAAGRNVRRAAEDFARDALVVRPGTRLLPHHLMALAACGVERVAVRRVPRGAILTTGAELAPAGVAPGPAGIHDANGPYLDALLALLGVQRHERASAGDDLPAIRQSIARLDGQCDVLLTTGGVSAGRLDLVPAAIQAAGGRVVFHKVAIRPGKPILYARLPRGTHVFGLPGNPLAVAVGMRFFCVPALRAWSGMPAEEPAPAICREAVRSRGGLRFFAKARRWNTTAGECQVELLPGQESFRIGPLLAANCWAVVAEDAADLPAGSRVDTVALYR